VSQYTQAIAPTITTPRAHFDMSHGTLTTIDFDYIYPTTWMEVYPGDTMTMDITAFGRFATLLYPLMDNAYLDTYVFYAPMRILWDNARKFWGEQVDPGDSIDYTVPRMTATATTGYAELSLADYLGLPTKVPDYTHISLPHRMYNFCYNEFFRDQNLQDSVVVDTDNGPDTVTDYVLLKRNKKHDYFTSGLPNLLKDPATAQTLPLGTDAPVIGIGKSDQSYTTGPSTTIYESDAGTTTYANYQQTNATVYIEEDTDNAGYPHIRADLTNATAATILQLRQAVQIQAILELDSRAGTRYPEQIYAVYGVRYDGESYRPEFLGSGSSRIDVHSVPQTSNDGTNGDVADLAAYGTVGQGNCQFTKSFDEPGIVMVLVAARADLTYQQGMNRCWDRTDRYSYYHPLLQNIGDQATLCKEIVMQNPATDTGSTGTADNEKTFNYQERYAELKYMPSKVTGLYRSNCTQSLEAWHLSEEFSAALPAFDSTFIQSNTPVDRAIALSTEPHLKLDVWHNCQMARPMNMYSIPGFGSRF
jgi:hypothetical protein